MGIRRRRIPLAVISTFAVWCSACDPYDSRRGQYSAGPVDPFTFPPENLGVTRAASFSARFRPGGGRFTGVSAFVTATERVDYFRFPIPSPTPRPMTFNPLAVPATAPVAYVFDPQPGIPFGASACTAPAGYQYDPARDDVRLDEQGTVFTALPTADYNPSVDAPITLVGGTRAYGPIVNTVRVTSKGLGCQATKSVRDVTSRTDVTLELGEPNPSTGQRLGVPSNQYAAAVIIDPGAPVYDSVFSATNPNTATRTPQGLGLQRWGWFNQFLLAYLEGGDLPTEMVSGRLQFKPQRLFVPLRILGANGMPADGVAGSGYDVLEFARGTAGYSPLCQVVTYETPMPLPAAMLPKSAADIVSSFAATLRNGDLFYCLQPQAPRP
jgi:hypothetical protein